jgi:hypothetical protein
MTPDDYLMFLGLGISLISFAAALMRRGSA